MRLIALKLADIDVATGLDVPPFAHHSVVLKVPFKNMPGRIVHKNPSSMSYITLLSILCSRLPFAFVPEISNRLDRPLLHGTERLLELKIIPNESIYFCKFFLS